MKKIVIVISYLFSKESHFYLKTLLNKIIKYSVLVPPKPEGNIGRCNGTKASAHQFHSSFDYQ